MTSESFLIMPFTTIDKGRIEMHLVSKADQQVRIELIDKSFGFKKANLFIQKIRINIHLNRYKPWQTKVDLN